MRFESLDEWLTWQEGLHPEEIDLGLDRIRPVYEKLVPEGFSQPVITVGGTNGKGSTVACLESIYLQSGYVTGTYTSPHLVRYQERICIQGQEIDEASLCAAFDAVDQARGDTSLTYFEFGTLAALYLFAQRKPDVIILEVGLGGRLDAVNVVDTDCAIITSIDLDHCDWLGTTRDAIAKEKAGIFRRGKPAICTDTSPPATLSEHAQQTGAQWLQLGEQFHVEVHPAEWRWNCIYPDGSGQDNSLPLPNVPGLEQVRNAAAALLAVDCLRARLPVSTAALRDGILSASLPGRFQSRHLVGEWILDVAHNPAGMTALVNNLQAQGCAGTTWAIFAAMADKDVAALTDILNPVIQHWFMPDLHNDRAMTPLEVSQTLEAPKLHGSVAISESVPAAVDAILERLEPEDRVVVTGSFITVGQVLEQLDRKAETRQTSPE